MDHFRLLLVDDEEPFALTVARALRSSQVRVDTAFCAREALALCKSSSYDMILLDHRLPDDDGVRLIPTLLALQPSAIVVMMTAYESIDSAVQAIRQGAYDYIVKSTSLDPILERVAEAQERKRVRQLSNSWDGHKTDGLLGETLAVRAVREQIKRVAASPETTVLITGESGVGKEVAVRYLHKMSYTDRRPFIAVDCMSIPETLAESLLFGHEKGTFTGANKAQPGYFADAQHGTLFLDEIGDLDIKLQGKLLRVIENRMFQRLGSSDQHPMEARIVAATNRDLQELVDKGTFRFDLYQRLSVFPIYIAPLRERREDILVLADHFQRFFFSRLGKVAEPLDREVADVLVSYDYSGNVRELKNIIERAVILAEENRIGLDHLPRRLVQAPLKTMTSGHPEGLPPFPFDFIPGVDTIESFEIKLINHALKLSGGVKKDAAQMLGISRFQLLRRLEKLNKETDGS